MPHDSHPPALARRVLEWAAGTRKASPLVGDLDEEFHEVQLPRRGAAAARRWYWKQVTGSVIPLLAARVRRRGRRGRRGDGMTGQLLQDLRYTARMLRKNAGFASMIMLTLALGIGANTIIYSAVDGLVLNPFPFPDGDELVAVGTQYPKLGGERINFIEHISPAEYVDLRETATSLERVVAWDMGNRQLSFGEITENVFTGFWWGNAFETLGIEPHVGRGMTWEETLTGERVAVLSHRLWANAFGADESLVGGSIMMNGNPYTVVGIMPEGTIMYGMDLWIPMGVDPSVFPRDRRQFQVVGRVAGGFSLGQVNAELETLARRTEQAWVGEFEEYEGWRMEADTWTGANVRTLKPAAFILLGAVGFVLLLVCANIASLLLARSTTRRREMAVRTAMGAGRNRLVRQVLTESLTLALLGGALGVGIAWFGVAALADVVAAIPFVSGGVAMNQRVLAFTLAISAFAGVTFGVLPAFQSARGGVAGALKSDAGGSTSTGSRLRVQRVFVAVEVALALVLLVGGGLFVNSVIRLNRVDPGFAAEEVLTMRLTLPWEEYDGPAIAAFFRELEERTLALPGVESVGVGSQFPPVAFSYVRVAAEGRNDVNEGRLPVALSTLVSPGYFEALGIPVVRGRGFDDLDLEGTPMAGVLNEAAADLLFPGEEPVGRRIVVEGDAIQVVGVVRNTLNRGIDEPPFPEIFANHRQVPGWANQLFLLVRTGIEPRSVLPAIREEIREMDADQPVYAIRTAGQALDQATASRRIAANVLSAFAAFALVLAAVGVFAVVSFSVSDRTREIGLRVALGAEGDQVRWLVVRQALVPVLFGALLGLAGSVALGKAVEGLLFGVRGTDTATLGSVFVILVATAALAGYLPATRASRLDPVRALREE